jgi:hypothetical protein
MAFDWAEFLAVAEHLHNVPAPTCTREALLRSVVGRAYYAAYGVAKKYAAQHLSFRVHDQPDDHNRLPRRFISHALPRVGVNLEALRFWRNECDYAELVDDLERVAVIALEKAHEIIDELAARQPPST